MTLNEVEQAMRNLITNQPVLAAGPSGEVVNGLLSIINSYRNFAFLVQNYPAQDNFKFNGTNLSQRTENDLANLICQTLQEHGINIMMYTPNTAFGMNQQYPNYGMNPNQQMVPPMNNQGMYNNPQMQPTYPTPSNGVQYNVPPMGGAYPQPQFRPNAGPRPTMVNPVMGNRPLYPRTPAPAQPIMFGDMEEQQSRVVKPQKRGDFTMPKPVAKPTKVAMQQPKQSNESVVRATPSFEQHKLKVDSSKRPEPIFEEPRRPAPEPKVEQNVEPEPKPHVEPTPEPKPEPRVEPKPEPVQVNEDAQDSNIVKATGRNYLLELLKK